MKINPVPFCENLFLYFFKCKYIKNLISLESSWQRPWRLIPDLCTVNNGDKFSIILNIFIRKNLNLKKKNETLLPLF